MLSDKPFAYIGVNSDPDKEELKNIIERNSINWRSFVQGVDSADTDAISKHWQVTAIPIAFVLDKDGVIRFKGHPSSKKMLKTIEELLADMGHLVDLSKIADMTADNSEKQK